MQAVDQVDVGVAARQVQALVAGRPAAAPGVAGPVRRAQVGLGLDQPDDQPLAVEPAHQIAPQQLPRHRLGGAAVEGAGQGAEAAHGRYRPRRV